MDQSSQKWTKAQSLYFDVLHIPQLSQVGRDVSKWTKVQIVGYYVLYVLWSVVHQVQYSRRHTHSYDTMNVVYRGTPMWTKVLKSGPKYS